MRQPNGCSTPAPRSRAAKQWTVTARSNEEEEEATFNVYFDQLIIETSDTETKFAFACNETYDLSRSVPQATRCRWHCCYQITSNLLNTLEKLFSHVHLDRKKSRHEVLPVKYNLT